MTQPLVSCVPEPKYGGPGCILGVATAAGDVGAHATQRVLTLRIPWWHAVTGLTQTSRRVVEWAAWQSVIGYALLK